MLQKGGKGGSHSSLFSGTTHPWLRRCSCDRSNFWGTQHMARTYGCSQKNPSSLYPHNCLRILWVGRCYLMVTEVNRAFKERRLANMAISAHQDPMLPNALTRWSNFLSALPHPYTRAGGNRCQSCRYQQWVGPDRKACTVGGYGDGGLTGSLAP